MIVMTVKATRANLGQSALTFTLPENENCCLPTAWGWHVIARPPHVPSCCCGGGLEGRADGAQGLPTVASRRAELLPTVASRRAEPQGSCWF